MQHVTERSTKTKPNTGGSIRVRLKTVPSGSFSSAETSELYFATNADSLHSHLLPHPSHPARAAMTETGARRRETAQHESHEQQLSPEHTERAQTELKGLTAPVIEGRKGKSGGVTEKMKHFRTKATVVSTLHF